MFWNKKNGSDSSKNLMDPDTYAKLLNRIVERDAEITSIKAKITGLQLDVDNFNRRLGQKLRELKKETEEVQAENNLNDEYIHFG
jgi:seryl-tRNA synthetase